MPRYSISHMVTSAPWGEYEGESPEAVLRVLYDEAGEPYPGDEAALATWSVEPIARTHLSRIIRESGLSIVECAAMVFGRDARTVRRWLAGETIPEAVAEWMARVRVSADADEVTISVQRQLSDLPLVSDNEE